jgi:hypothetical protein
MTTRTPYRTALAFLAAMLTPGCGVDGSAPRARVEVVLVDRSGSIDPRDRDLYARSLAAVADEMEPGDRLVVAVVGDDSRSAFQPLIDITVPQTAIRVDQEKGRAAARRAVANAIPAILGTGNDRGGASSTHLLDTIAGASQAFSSSRAGSLILLSDGVEDSEVGNVDKLRSPEEIEEMLGKARRAGLLPQLKDVSLTVIGAGGRDYDRVELFWRAYAAATHMTIAAYGRMAYRPIPRGR